ncbi:MAG: midcut-by-XrtH protein [Pseudomonadota bacterium]
MDQESSSGSASYYKLRLYNRFKTRDTSSVVAVALGALSFTHPSSAQLFYSPAPSAEAIPTMSAMALGLLCMALLFAAVKKGKFSKSGVTMSLFAGAVLSGLLSVQVFEEARADGGSFTKGGLAVIGLIDSPVGGSVPITTDRLNVFENTSGVPQGIDEIVLPASCPNRNSGSIDGVTQCFVGTTVPTGASGMCYTDCRDE